MLTDCADVAASVAVAVAARRSSKGNSRQASKLLGHHSTHPHANERHKQSREKGNRRVRERGGGERGRRKGEQELRFGNRVGCVLFDSHTQIVNRLKLNAA